jgi:hypothetical protein
MQGTWMMMKVAKRSACTEARCQEDDSCQSSNDSGLLLMTDEDSPASNVGTVKSKISPLI